LFMSGGLAQTNYAPEFNLGGATGGTLGTNELSMSLSELLIYNNPTGGVMASADVTQVQNYLEQTWGMVSPEPGTLVLLVTGCLGLAACAWRRRRK